MQSTLIGCLLGTLPEWPFLQLGNLVETAAGIMAMPGLIIALVLSGGMLHDIRYGFATIANCFFYGILSYLFLRIRSSRR